uniref:Uncharacterized protein n=1 Tax=Oryza punctata TaxID=4537 RepID=A0A0E0MND9_ORYPU
MAIRGPTGIGGGVARHRRGWQLAVWRGSGQWAASTLNVDTDGEPTGVGAEWARMTVSGGLGAWSGHGWSKGVAVGGGSAPGSLHLTQP